MVTIMARLECKTNLSEIMFNHKSIEYNNTSSISQWAKSSKIVSLREKINFYSKANFMFLDTFRLVIYLKSQNFCCKITNKT